MTFMSYPCCSIETKKSHDLNSTSMVHLDAWNHGSFMPRSLHIQTTCLGGFRSLAKGAKVLYRSKTWKNPWKPTVPTWKHQGVPWCQKSTPDVPFINVDKTDLKLRKFGVYHGLSKITIGWVTLPNDMISTLPSQVSGYYDIMSDIFGYQ